MPSNRYQPFPNTHWSLVHRAGFAEGEARREALATLLARYEPALFFYLCRVKALPAETARDILQGFIGDKILEYRLLQHADKGKGRFRTFLLTSLNHFAVDQFRYQNRRIACSEDFDMFPGTPSSGSSPPAIVEAAWARSLIRAVLENMKTECERTLRPDIWKVFESRILAEFFDGREPVSYEKLAADLELDSPMQAANLLVTGKRMYARLLRAAIAEYETESSNVEGEIADLSRALEIPESE